MSHDGFYASGTKPFRGILIWYIDHSPWCTRCEAVKHRPLTTHHTPLTRTLSQHSTWNPHRWKFPFLPAPTSSQLDTLITTALKLDTLNTTALKLDTRITTALKLDTLNTTALKLDTLITTALKLDSNVLSILDTHLYWDDVDTLASTDFLLSWIPRSKLCCSKTHWSHVSIHPNSLLSLE